MTERTYTIQLRKGFLKVPKWRRAKRAMNDIRAYLEKHTKSNEIKLDHWINEKVWQHGGRNPPSKIMLKVSFDKKTANAALTEVSARAKRATEETKKMEEKKNKKSFLKLAKDEKEKKAEEHKKKKSEEKKALEESEKNKTLSKKEEIASQK
ncbi:MAG: 50S ribosomal protein L31e [DPANN group archaeon]|nr:50S ribosomal protein L31e [DPANN group archaeon]